MLKIAKTAGFCFGVQNAVETVNGLLEQNEKVCTLGNIINNPFIVENFRNKGVRVLNNVFEAKKEEILVIRSHGVSLKTYEEIERLYLKFKDATCSFVKRIQNKVLKKANLGKTILIAGDRNHPEVVGITGYCKEKVYIFSSLCEAEELFNLNKTLKTEDIFLVAQTTFNLKTWEKCVKYLQYVCFNLEVFNSICLETKKRQAEAEYYSKLSDFSIVIGGKNSSNTKKLFEICCRNCKTFFIENYIDFKKIDYNFKSKRGFITAGASTPKEMISTISNEIIELSK